MPRPDLAGRGRVLDMSRFALANINRGELDGRGIPQESSCDVMWNPLGTEANTFGVSWFVIGCRGAEPGSRVPSEIPRTAAGK
jgi:hypothetical protein